MLSTYCNSFDGWSKTERDRETKGRDTEIERGNYEKGKERKM